MSTEQATKQHLTSRFRSSWSSVAFIVEAMVLLVFLVASFAVLTQLFSASLNRSVQSRSLDAATIAATSIAEHFAADPTAVQDSVQLGDLNIVTDVVKESHDNGVVYTAHIKVYDTRENKQVYELTTSRYSRGVE